MGQGVRIPADVYESREEIVVVVPLGGVAKESIAVRLVDGTLVVAGERVQPHLKDGFVPLEQQCYWGGFEKQIPLPASVYYDNIDVSCYVDNILVIIVPKMIVPQERDYTIQFVSHQHASSRRGINTAASKKKDDDVRMRENVTDLPHRDDTVGLRDDRSSQSVRTTVSGWEEDDDNNDVSHAGFDITSLTQDDTSHDT